MASVCAKACSDHEVLVVEDDPEINRLIGAYVEFAGLHYLSALDGLSALSEARSHTPRVVVLDLMLPDVSGWEVCRQLRASEQTRKVPVIILTALDTEESREQAVIFGASEYLTKPFDPDQLLALLKKYAGLQVQTHDA